MRDLEKINKARQAMRDSYEVWRKLERERVDAANAASTAFAKYNSALIAYDEACLEDDE